MKKLYQLLLVGCLSLIASNALAQAVLIDPNGDGGFESGTTFAANNWTAVNPANTALWQIGTAATGFTGNRSAFVGPNATTYTYTNTASRTCHIYRTVTMPAGATSISLTFVLKSVGEVGWDRLLVYTAPTTVTPAANSPASSSTAMTGATLVFTQASTTTYASGYTAVTVTLPNTLAGTTFRLIFTWQNDGSAGTAPPAAVDNIKLTYCPAAGTLAAAASSTSICPGSTLTLTGSFPGALSYTGSSYTWTGPGSYSGATNPATRVIAAATPSGIYTLSTVITGCGTYTATTSSVTVLASPTVSVTASPVCSPASLTASGAVSYTWAPASGASPSNAATTTATAASQTIFTVTGTAANGCTATANVTVNPTPTLSGATAICTGRTGTITGSIAGGSWTTSDPLIATVLSSGTTTTVTPVAAGAVTITYTLPTGCYVVRNVTINQTPTVSATGGTYCSNLLTPVTLTASGTGATYTWAPAATLSASTGSSVNSTPVSVGLTTYTVTNTSAAGCSATATAVVDYHLAATDIDTRIGGSSVCLPGLTPYFAVYSLGASTLSNIYAYGGTYSSSNTSVATVDGAGYVYGAALGTATISYSDAGCSYYITKDVTISGDGFSIAVTPDHSYIYCNSGSGVTLNTDLSGPGAAGVDTWLWTKSDLSTATGLSSTTVGTVTASPTVTTTYQISATNSATGCHAADTVRVSNFSPGNITGGSQNLCVPGTSTWSCTPAAGSGGAGTWSSSNTAIATVTSGGVVGAAGSGNTTIIYTSATGGCYSSRTVTVNTIPTTAVTTSGCANPSYALTATGATTYSWSPSTFLSAATGSSVTSTPTSPTTYTVTGTNGVCATTNATVTVTPTPQAIGGSSSICGAQAVTLLAQNCTSTTGQTGGTWTIYSNGTYASSGTYNFNIRTTTYPDTYNPTTWTGGFLAASANLAGSGVVVRTFFKSPAFSTVNMPSASISFNHYYPNAYSGDSVRLEYSLNGTTWTDMGGFTAATTNTDLTAAGSLASFSLPAGALGQPTVYVQFKYRSGFGYEWYIDNITVQGTQQNSITLTEAVTGGSWLSSATSIATVSPSGGVVTGLNIGTSTITYFTSSCGMALKSVTVLGTPATIGGSLNIAVGSSSSLTNSTLYGTWSVGSTAIATVNSSTGEVFGVSNGTTGVTYSTGCGSAATATITVSTPCTGTPTPGTAAISPTSGGSTTAFSAAVTGYDLSSGITFQWQKSTTSSTSGFTDIPGATNATYNFTGITTNSWFQCVVTCGITSLSATSTVAAATYYPPSSCTPTWIYPNYACTYYYGLVETTGYPFTITGASGSLSDNGACSAAGYIDRSASGPTVTFNQGNSYIANFTANINGYSTGDQIWIDFNNDGAFSASESVGGSSGWTTTSRAEPFSIPGTPSVTSGTFRMRVETQYFYGSYPNYPPCPDATGTNYYGDVRDYKVNILALPAITVTGSVTTLCQGVTVTFANATAGGTWTSSNNSYVAINASTGVATGGSASGVDTIYYTASGMQTYYVITNTANPTTISGSSTVCVSQQVSLTDGIAGGTWSSSDISKATVNSSTGVVGGVAGGTVTISYSTGCGTPATFPMTVNALPGTTTASTTAMCTGATATLTNTVPGGSWISSNSSIASVDPVSGVVTGTGGGTVTISYSMGCLTYATTAMSVNDAPADINPLTTVDMCVGLTTTLSNASLGGTWSSNNTLIATVNSGTGVVGGAAAGTTTITYSNGCGAPATRDVNVNVPPNASITGTSPVCQYGTTTYANTVGGGSWVSANTAIATVDATTGDIGGVAGGTTTISYITTGCNPVTRTISVTPTPAAITGSSILCPSTGTVLSNAITGGTWSTSDATRVTVNSSTGAIGATTLTGNSTITYSNGCAPAATLVVTVSGSAAPITGTFSLCAPAPVTLVAQNCTSLTGQIGGTWTIYNTGTYDPAGPYNFNIRTSTYPDTYNPTAWNGGFLAASANLAGSVPVVRTFFKSPAFSTIGMTSASLSFNHYYPSFYSGDSARLEYSLNGTTWTDMGGFTAATTNTDLTAAGSLATITLPAGALGQPTLYVQFKYRSGFGYEWYIDNVVVSGTQQGTTTLTDATPGGTWAPTTGTPATVNATTGVVTGISAGTRSITYTAACGAPVTQVITVNPVPGTTSGTTPICQGATATWTNTAGAGTWSSSDNTVATVNPSTGVVTGVSAGTAIITFSNGCGTAATRAISVTATPAAITGSTALCPGGTGTLLNSVAGGTWSSGTTANVTVNASTGAVYAVTGVTSGTSVITYSNGCAPSATTTVTISGTPGAITGTAMVCAPSAVTLLAQNWENGAPNSTTAVDGWSQISGTYMASISAVSSATNPTVSSAQSGNNFLYWNSYSVTTGGTATLYSPSFSMVSYAGAQLSVWVYREVGGSYSGSTLEGFTFYVNTTPSTAGATTLGFVPRSSIGNPTGVSGTANPTTSGWYQYTANIPSSYVGATNYILIYAYSQFGNNCFLDNLTVTAAAHATTLASSTPGGTWTSYNTGVATVGAANGVVTGVSAGTAVISYATACGSVGTTVTVNPVPGVTSGASFVCVGSTTSMTNTISGGTWSSSNTAVATVDPTSGIVTGVAQGTASISYVNGCGSATPVSIQVRALPTAITGSTALCQLSTGTLYNTANGGTWTSSDASIATVNINTGVIGATSINGTTTITYSNSCGSPVSIVATVSNVTAAIAGTPYLCVPSATTVTILTQDWETPAGSAVPTSTTAVNGWTKLTPLPSFNYLTTSSAGSAPSATAQSGTYFMSNYCYYFYGNNTVCSPSLALNNYTGVNLTFYVYRDVNATYNTATYAAEGFRVLINNTNSLSGATTLGFVPRAAGVAISGSYISGTSTTTTGGWYQYTCNIPVALQSSSNYILITAAVDPSVSSFEYAYLDNVKITGNPSYNTALTDATPGGAWSSSNPSVAPVDVNTGVVRGLSAGTATITYTGPCGTPVTQVVTVNGAPATVSGAGSICIGASLTLSNSATGGTWSTTAGTIATVDATTGMVTGLTAGSAPITYSNGCGTATTGTVIVKSPPSAIVGASSMCPSSTTNLSNPVSGGTWSSTNTSVATVGTFSGIVYSTGVADTTTIVYGNGCLPNVYSSITVSSSTDTIVGVSSICALPTPLVSTSFESGVPSVQGTAVAGWNYLQGTGAANNYWSSIAGTSTTNPATSGTPSGGGTSVAKFGSNTIASGNSAFLVSPSFDLSGGNGGRVTMHFYRDGNLTAAYDSLAVYINTSPSASGAIRIGSVCRSRTLSTAYVGTAVAAGWQKLTFTIPSTFTGSSNYILFKGYSAAGNNMYMDSIQIRNNSGSATFTDATAGGTWSTSDALVATITTTGVVSAISAGSATISYTGACGAPVTKSIVVNPVPGSNTSGSTTLCVGATTTVANVLAGGTWYSSNPSIATVDVSGNVTALGAGTAVISYFNGCGAAATTTFTVNPVPTVASVTPSATDICAGATLTLTAGAVTGTGTLTSYNWSGPESYSATTTANFHSHAVATSASTGAFSLSVTYPGLGCTSAPVASSTVIVYDYPLTQNVTGGNGCSASTITVGLDGSQAGLTYALILAPSTSVATLTGTGSAVSFASVNTVGNYIVKSTTGPGCTTTMIGSDTVRQTPSLSLAVIPNLCEGITPVSIGYTPTVGSPITYSIDWDATAEAAGFLDVTNAALSGGSISVSVPSSGAIGLFNGVVTASNGYCTSASYSRSVTIYTLPTMTMTDTVVPCYNRAGSISFSGPDSTTVNYKLNGVANSFRFAGTTYTLPTAVLTSNAQYVIVSATNGVCPAHIYNDTVDITPIPLTWIGGTPGGPTAWDSASNWSCGFVPSSSDSVTIPGTLYPPVLPVGVTASVSDLDLSTGTTIDLAGGNMSVTGNIHNAGVVSGSGRVVLAGSSAQKIYGIGTIDNLELNNTSGATIQPGARMMIGKVLYLTTGTLTTNDSLELLSNDTTPAARIAEIPSSGAGITGRVKTDQFVPGGSRRFRFWGHSFSDTISLSQLLPYVDITGPGGAANGFVPTTTNNPSAFRYDPTVGDDRLGNDPGWKPFTQINSGAADNNKLHPGQGIRLFFRGAPGEGLGYLGYLNMYDPSSTITKMMGHVNQGPVSIPLAQGSDTAHQSYNQISNPYPSPVDIGTVLYNARAAGQVKGSAFYVWNPRLSAGGQYMAIPIGESAPEPYYIQANTSFQVKADHSGAHVDFVESNKGASAALNLFRAPAQAVRFNIYDTNYHLWDMLSLQFNDKASDDEDKQLDATKPFGADLNFYSLSKNGAKLAIDARPYEGDKVIPLGITSAYQQDFVLRAEAINVPTGGAVTLHDKLLNKYVELKEGTEYRFSIGKDKATQGDDRFELSLKPTKAAVVKGLEVAMAPNPASDDVKITFTSGSKDNVSVRIMDVSGVSIYSQDLGAKQNGVITVPMSNFAAGVYMVELTQGEQKVTKRLVKE